MAMAALLLRSVHPEEKRSLKCFTLNEHASKKIKKRIHFHETIKSRDLPVKVD